MKKLFFVATTPFAVNAFLLNHLLSLSQRYEVVLVVNTGVYPLVDTLQNRIRVIDVKLARKISLFRDFSCLLTLTRLLMREKPDAVHSIMPKSGLLAMLAGSMARVPLRFHTFTGQVWANKIGWRRRILKGFDQLIAALSTKVLADSPSQARFLEIERVTKSGQVLVLGEGSIAGVDPQRFKRDDGIRSSLRAEHGATSSTIIFLFVGRINRDKGVPDLVEAYRCVAKSGVNSALWIVGPDDENIVSDLEQAGANLPIRFFEATPAPEKFMGAADVLVLPSYREGFGNVIIEAAACSLPTVAYRIDGVIDAVVDGKTGQLVEVGDVDGLSSAMNKLANDNALRRGLGEAAHRRVVAHFSAQSVTARWVEFYRQALKHL